MSRWINALYDTRAEAEVARARLSSEIGLEDIRILSKTNRGELSKLSLSDADHKSYSDGIERGAVLLTANSRGKEDDAKIVRILEEAARGGRAREDALPHGSGAMGSSNTVEERRIPLVEEELRVGKREVVRGGARVQTHVREVPAEASVTLKQERLDVDRRPVGRSLSDADVHAEGVLKPRVVEISEIREEAVIGKEAFVREEVVVRKTVEERTETVRDTIKRTEVDVDEYRAPDLAGSGDYRDR